MLYLSAHATIAVGRSARAALALALAATMLSGLLPLANVHAAPLPAAAEPATADSPAPLKAVIVVGPTHSSTSRYLGFGESLAQLAESYGMDVRRVFHPNATAERLKTAIQGANLVAYFGHGNGWPSPYAPFQEKTKNGMGLNGVEGGSQNSVTYYGGNWFRNNVVLAENAVVLFGGLCYAEGNGESGMAIPSWDVARQRVDNFAAAFLAIGAGAVYAYGWQSVNSVLDGLMTTDKTVDEIFMTKGWGTSPSSGFLDWDDRYFDSQRMPGFQNHLDPHADLGFLRAMSGNMSLTAAAWRGGAPPENGGGDVTPTPPPAPATPPTQPQGLTANSPAEGVVNLSWQPSTSSVAGTMRYRVLRNGDKVSTLITATSYTDQPAAGTHSYMVRAVDANGVVSVDSSPVSVTVAAASTPPPTTSPSTPTVPQNVTATHAGAGTVQVTWDASTSANLGTMRYRVFRNGKAIGSKQKSRAYTDTVAPGTHRYQVRAIDGAGYKSAKSVDAWVTVPAAASGDVSSPDVVAPSVPTNLTATSLGKRRVGLSWAASTDDGGGTIKYVVFRNKRRIATLTTTSLTDRPRYARTYRYRVRAVDSAGNRSAFSTTYGTAVRGAIQ